MAYSIQSFLSLANLFSFVFFLAQSSCDVDRFSPAWSWSSSSRATACNVPCHIKVESYVTAELPCL